MNGEPGEKSVIEEILRLQQERTDAIVAADGPALEKLFDDDLVHVHASGRLESKAEFIDRVATRKAVYSRIDYDNVKVRVYGDCAVATGDVFIENNTQRMELRYTNVWVKRSSRWRSVSWHSTKRTA